MTLLESISAAAVAATGGTLSPPNSKFPLTLNPDDVLPKLTPSIEPSPASSLINRVSGWEISETDSEIAEFCADLSKNLRNKLKNARSLPKGEFLSLLNSFLIKISKKAGLSIDWNASNPSDPNFTRAAIEKLGSLIGREGLGLIVEGCLVLDVYDVLGTLIRQNLAGNLYSVNLIEKLVEKKQSELLCVCVGKIPNLRSSELHAILKFFLSPSKDYYSSMIGIRKKWEKEAILAIEKATQKGLPKKDSILAKEAALLLMMAHDNFSSSEICLHYVFGSANLDGLVVSSAVSRLDGVEVLGLVRYFLKWLEKYERFPQAKPCPSAVSACESIPSLESVVRGLGIVFDEHFSYLVLNSEFHDELRAVERVMGSLVMEADSCCPVNDIINHLRFEVRNH